jgi:hypothetical protein
MVFNADTHWIFESLSEFVLRLMAMGERGLSELSRLRPILQPSS